MTAEAGGHVLSSVRIDETSLAVASKDAEHERQVAISDLLQENTFEPAGAHGGPYGLELALVDGRLALDVTGPRYERRFLLSLTPFRSVIKDYFLICESYDQAVRDSAPSQIEAIDMGRRGLHNEGADLLRERLSDKIVVDLGTSRRLFTLICSLHWRG